MATGQGFQLNVKHDIERFLTRINDIQLSEVPFVTAYALTKTAQDIQAEEIKEMSQVFDRPTRFTLNSLFVKPATKTDKRAQVRFKEGFGSIPAFKFLGPEVEGGDRSSKAHELRLQRAGILKPGEFVVPGAGAPLDAFGNIPGPTIERILSQLQTAGGSGYQANETTRSRKRNKAAQRYVVMRGKPGVKDGIYMRAEAHRIVPILIFVTQPHYHRRLDFYGIAKRVFSLNFARHFREGWDRYVNHSTSASKAA